MSSLKTLAALFGGAATPIPMLSGKQQSFFPEPPPSSTSMAASGGKDMANINIFIGGSSSDLKRSISIKGSRLLQYANATTANTSTTNVLLYLIIILQEANMSLIGNAAGQGPQGVGGLFGTQTAPAGQSTGLFGGF